MKVDVKALIEKLTNSTIKQSDITATSDGSGFINISNIIGITPSNAHIISVTSNGTAGVGYLPFNGGNNMWYFKCFNISTMNAVPNTSQSVRVYYK